MTEENVEDPYSDAGYSEEPVDREEPVEAVVEAVVEPVSQPRTPTPMPAPFNGGAPMHYQQPPMGTVDGNSPSVNNIGSRPTLPSYHAPQAVAVPDAQTAIQESLRLEQLAEGYMENRQYHEAFEISSQATLLSPKNVKAWVTRANAALNLKKYDEADFAADRARQHAPRSAEVFELSGRVNHAKRDYEEALEAYREAVRLDPQNPFYATRVNLMIRLLGDPVTATAKARGLYERYLNDRSARESYAQHLIWNIQRTLREYGDDRYFNSSRDIRSAENSLATIDSIDVSSKDLLNDIREVKDLVDISKGFGVVNPGTMLVLKFLGVGVLMLFLAQYFFLHWILGMVWTIVFLGGLGYLLFISVKPAWRIRKMRILS